MDVIKGTNKSPKPDSLYVVFRQDHKGRSVGHAIRGGDCNWQSGEIVAHVELPLLMSEAEVLAFRRSGQLGSDLTAN